MPLKRGTRLHWTGKEVTGVEALARAGLSRRFIARCFKVKPETLEARFGRDMFVDGHRGRDAPAYTDQDRKLVETMASFGIPQVDIASVLGVGVESLRAHFRDEITRGPIAANARVAGFLFNQIRQGSTTGAIFWLKARAGWRETQTIEVQQSTGVLVAPAATAPQDWLAQFEDVEVIDADGSGKPLALPDSPAEDADLDALLS